MNSLENKLIVYDSNCKVCSSLRDVVLKLTTISPQKVKAYAELNDRLRSKVDAEKFRNVMALIDTTGGETIYGAEGIAYIFSSQYRLIHLLMRVPPFFRIFAFLYKVQAYNRYIIATPKSKFRCDCFPDRIVSYRISFIVIAVIISLALTALFGISLREFFGVSAAVAAIRMILIAGTGWVLQILLAILLLKNKALDYIGHLASIMVAGLLILMPAVCLYALTGILSPYVPAASVILSSGYMLYLHSGRASYLELSRWWTVSWFLLLQSTALFWVYVFHMK